MTHGFLPVLSTVALELGCQKNREKESGGGAGGLKPAGSSGFPCFIS